MEMKNLSFALHVYNSGMPRPTDSANELKRFAQRSPITHLTAEPIFFEDQPGHLQVIIDTAPRQLLFLNCVLEKREGPFKVCLRPGRGLKKLGMGIHEADKSLLPHVLPGLIGLHHAEQLRSWFDHVHCLLIQHPTNNPDMNTHTS
jgi:hypothetical protein